MGIGKGDCYGYEEDLFNLKIRIMSIISILSPNKRQLVASKPLLNILHQIRSGLYQKEVEQFRRYARTHLEASEEIRNDQLPWFSIAGHFKQRNRGLELISYSKCMLLELFFLDESDFQTMKEQLLEDARVMACFRNAKGTGLCFVVATDCPMTEYTYGFWKVKSQDKSLSKTLCLPLKI